MIAVIGRKWVNSTTADGKIRLNDPNDFIRIEIEAALNRLIPLVPILIDGTPSLKIEELPSSLHPLC